MINKESKTLREFSAEFYRNNSKLTVYFGYDTAAYHSGFYIDASLNNDKRSSSPEMLRKIRALDVDVFNQLIDAVGSTVYGVPSDFDELSVQIVESHLANSIEFPIEFVDRFYRLDSNDKCPNCIALSNMMHDYSKKSVTNKQKKAIIKKFNNSQRTRLMELTRNLIREIRELQISGIPWAADMVEISFEGLLRQKHNPTYYKRDIDYVRKARVRLFRDVLKRKYVPFSN